MKPYGICLVARLVGEEPKSQYWKDVMTPIIECPFAFPEFHESGYASGHAEESIEVPGLFAWIKAHSDSTHAHYSVTEDGKFTHCWGWTRIRFKDCTRNVFLHSRYDRCRGDEVFYMSN